MSLEVIPTLNLLYPVLLLTLSGFGRPLHGPAGLPRSSLCCRERTQTAAALIQPRGLGGQEPQPRRCDCRASPVPCCSLWRFKGSRFHRKECYWFLPKCKFFQKSSNTIFIFPPRSPPKSCRYKVAL